MLAAAFPFRKQVLLQIARFVGWSDWPKSAEVDNAIEDACDFINQQQEQIREVTMRRDLLTIEVQLLEDEVKWMKAVLDAAGVKLQDYDYMRRKREQ